MASSPEEGKKFLSRSEVAEIFKVSPNTVTRWAEEGRLPYIRTLGGHRRYEAATILELARQMAGEEESMEKATFYIPGMYGDHHVITVRRLLTALDGVEDVWASAAFQQAVVTYDPGAISADEIRARLETNGYPVGNGQQPEMPPRHEKDPAWDKIGIRMTTTNRADIEMSGDFRRY